jgi:phosphohistidine phosphatase
MKRLTLVRHAKSDWGNGQIDDIDRPLNARGYADAKSMAMRMKASGNIPDVLFSSTAVRAATTALIFIRTLALKESQLILTAKLYEASESKFLKLIQELPDEFGNVCVFGHNPTITAMANLLSGSAILNMPTCGLAVLDAEVPSWKEFRTAKLVLFDYPKNQGEMD